MNISRIKNKLVARLFTAFPALARAAAAKVPPLKLDETPWVSFAKPLSQARIGLVTTAGAHLKTDIPFDMVDSTGDPTFRMIPSASRAGDIMITHDYYDHSDADRDINIVFPLERLREMVAAGEIGSLTRRFFSFMGHIEENHFPRFLVEQAPLVAAMFKEDGVDAVIVAPG